MTDKKTPQRLDVAGAIYYVDLKSSGQRSLFTDRPSFEFFVDSLIKLHSETGSQTLAYCLLQNQIHLILHSGPEGIIETTRWLTQNFSNFYNEQNNRNGSVFQKQTSCTLIEPSQYLLPAIKQIHYLPVTMGLVAEPSIYPWLSHKHYLENHAVNSWFNNDLLLNIIGHQRSNRSKRYEHSMRLPPVTELDLSKGNNANVQAFASNTYIEKLLSKSSPEKKHTPSLEWLRENICLEYTVDEKELTLWRRHRLTGEIKGAIAALAVTFNSADIQTVAEFLNEDPELLENSVRSLANQRQMFLHNLQLKLQSKLNTAMTQSHNINDLDSSGSSASTSFSVIDS